VGFELECPFGGSGTITKVTWATVLWLLCMFGVWCLGACIRTKAVASGSVHWQWQHALCTLQEPRFLAECNSGKFPKHQHQQQHQGSPLATVMATAKWNLSGPCVF
jgi:hypothetical protein